MNLYLKQRVFSWKDRFEVYDELGNVCYTVEGEMFTFGKKLHVFDRFGQERVFIREKAWSLFPKYYIDRNGCEVAEVVREFSWFKPRYTIRGLDWQVFGDFWDHEYEINNGILPIVRVSKEWFSWGDAYRLWIDDGVDEATALAVVLIIDACLERQSNYT